MAHPFLRKLRHGAHLTQDNENVLIALTRPVRSLGAREDVSIEGEPRGRRLTIHNLRGLRELSLFDESYLHRVTSPSRHQPHAALGELA